MARNPGHAMLSRPTHDERARQAFIGAMKAFVGRKLRPGNRKSFEMLTAPAYARAHGEPPRTTAEIAAAMRGDLHWQFFSALARTGQEKMWTAVVDTLLHDEGRLRKVYRELTAAPDKLGSLELDPECAVPPALRDTEVHLQPGGYFLNRDADDFLAGALYETGGALYSHALGVGAEQSKGEIIVEFLTGLYPGFRPERILDLACAAGASTTPYAEAFPEAEIHGIDVAPALLRYAHARAESLGVAVHFHQRNAMDTGFDDGSFDLVVSHNAMHEMATAAVAAMFTESLRLLRPGGICIHQDIPLRYAELDDYSRFEFGWDRDFNGEIFWDDFADSDTAAMLTDAGFSPDDIFVGYADQADGNWRWYVACARKRGVN